MPEIDLYNGIGFLGTALYLISFALLSKRKIDSDTVTYMAMNLAAAVCVLISLIEYWNAPVFVIQSSWVIIAIIGISERLTGKPQKVKM